MNNSPKYWVACSGGVDSVVLLHLVLETKSKSEVGILHCNFHLREEASNEDENFVRQLAKEHNVPLRMRDFDTKQYAKIHRLNTQLAARELRYNWFNEIIREKQAMVLLAHHYDDQLETFFLQLRRGGKVKGLSGMPEYREGYLRPLLKYTKEELISLAHQQHWKWREDVTNASNDYSRNWYRNEVLPFLKSKGFPMHEVVPLMHSFQTVLHFLKGIEIPDSIQIKDWLTYPVWIQQHILSEHGLGEYEVSEIARLTKSEKGKYIGNDHAKVWNEGKTLVFVKEESLSMANQLVVSIHFIEEVEINTTDLFFDAAKVNGPFNIRKWRTGDRLQPLGMKGEKLVGKFLRDRKVAAHKKEHVQVLVNAEDEILGVFGFGVGERYKVDEGTVKVVKAVVAYKSSRADID